MITSAADAALARSFENVERPKMRCAAVPQMIAPISSSAPREVRGDEAKHNCVICLEGVNELSSHSLSQASLAKLPCIDSIGDTGVAGNLMPLSILDGEKLAQASIKFVIRGSSPP